MEKNQSKKACMFYVSDYHFEMIGLLNMKNAIKENKKVIVLTQENLEKTANELISKINLKTEEKHNLEKIDWNNKDINKYKDIQNAIKENKGLAIYIKGDEKYIQKQNEHINEIIKGGEYSQKVSIVDCYDFNDIGDKCNTIIKNYDMKLTTRKQLT